MLYIKVPDMNDSVSNLSIDGTVYKLRFTYNEYGDYWSFTLMDSEKNVIMPMMKIVPNFPLSFFHKKAAMPDGIWGCLSNLSQVGREAFNDKEAEFIYIPNDELEG